VFRTLSCFQAHRLGRLTTKGNGGPAESSGHNVPFPHGQSGEQGLGGGSARHSGQVPDNAVPLSGEPKPTQYFSVAPNPHLDLGPSSKCDPNAEQRERSHSSKHP
jgi:hypothetical protein